jgi:hypothetical protein
MHGHACAAEYPIAAENFTIVDDKTAGPAQIAQRDRKRAARLAQIDLD